MSTPTSNAEMKHTATPVPTNYPWLEMAHFLPTNSDTMLLAWVRGEHVTYRTGRYLGGKFIGTSRDAFRTQPHYFRDVTGLFTPPDEGDKLRHENALLLAQNEAMRKALARYMDQSEALFNHCLSNGIFNRWGHAFDCTGLNAAELAAKAALNPPPTK